MSSFDNLTSYVLYSFSVTLFVLPSIVLRGKGTFPERSTAGNRMNGSCEC